MHKSSWETRKHDSRESLDVALDLDLELAFHYAHGFGVPQDMIKSRSFSDRILRDPSPNAWPVQAVLYEEGLGVDQDLAKAIALYEKSVRLQASSRGFAVYWLEKIKELQERQKEKADAAYETFMRQLDAEEAQRNRPTHKTPQIKGTSSKASSEQAALEFHNEPPTTHDIDIAGHMLMERLNNAIRYADKNFIKNI